MNDAKHPVLGRDVFLAPTAYVGGDVEIGDQSTVMHHVVIRGDIAPIRIGARVNIQDGTILHTSDDAPLELGDDIAVGHRAIVHCRRVGSRTLIGMGSILLDYCDIGSRCIIGAGAVLTPGTAVPDGSVVMGVPGRVIRHVTPRDQEAIDHAVCSYLAIGPLHAAGAFRNIAGGGQNAHVSGDPPPQDCSGER